MSMPTVAIIGRMNVGKSTLYNRLTGARHAIVSSWPGTTRDVHHGVCVWRGYEFEVLDTGGLDVEDDEQLEERVIAASKRAIAEADVLLFVIDGQTGVLPQDKPLVRLVKKSGKPAILVVNKIDSAKKEQQLPPEVYRVGLDPMFVISSSNGRGTGDLLDALHTQLSKMPAALHAVQRTSVAIVGRPNVGKSSILNAILGDDRVIVADQAHTTRDINDIPYSYKDHNFLLIDTAGIRKQSNVGMRWRDKRLGQIEKQSVRLAMTSIERADVVVLVLEAQERITAQDKKIADLANASQKNVIIVVNKWDLVEEKTPTTINEFTEYFDANLPFMRFAPIIFTSAKDRLRVKEILDVVLTVAENNAREIAPEDLGAIFHKIVSGYVRPPKHRQKGDQKYAKLLGLSQIGTKPPRFLLRSTRPKDVPKAIVKIIERELRDRFDFDGVRIVIEVGK